MKKQLILFSCGILFSVHTNHVACVQSDKINFDKKCNFKSMKLFKLIPAILLFASCAGNNNDTRTDDVDSSFVSDTVFTAKTGSDTSYEIVESKGYY